MFPVTDIWEWANSFIGDFRLANIVKDKRQLAVCLPPRWSPPQEGFSKLHERQDQVRTVRFRHLRARNGASTKANALGMRPMQERAYEKRGEQYLLIKSPPASGKSRALMFVALDKLKNQGFEAGHHRCAGEVHRCQLQRRAAVQVRLLGRLAGIEPKWNLCNAPGNDNGRC